LTTCIKCANVLAIAEEDIASLLDVNIIPTPSDQQEVFTMALPNFPVDHTAPKPVGGNSVTVKVPRWLVSAIVAILVLTAVYVLGTTFKERISDPVINKSVETVDNGSAGIAAMPAEQREAEIIAAVQVRFRELYGVSPESVGSTFRLASREEAEALDANLGGGIYATRAPQDAVFVIETQGNGTRVWCTVPTSSGWEVQK